MEHHTWEKFYEDSVHFTKPAKAEKLLSGNTVSEMKQLLKDVVDNFLKKGEVHIGLKTYINKELRNDLNNYMLEKRPSAEDSLESWSRTIFGEEKFGMIMNYLEEYSNDFSERAAQIVSPLLQIAGMPMEGFSFLFFMGNYGFTPFGVHKEAIGEEGILFHLGPGKKQFYTWDDPEYNNIEHNTEVFHNVEEMLPKSICYELNPGDAMMIPHQVFHIANSQEFSVSFVMDYVNPPMDRFENELIKSAEQEDLSLHSGFQVPLNLQNSPEEWVKMMNKSSLQKKLEISLQRKILSLKSNGGILRKSKLALNSAFPEGNFSIQGKPVFPIYMLEANEDQVLIFARGHRFIKKDHTALKGLISRINTGKIIGIDEIRNTLEPDWDLVETFGFIDNLARTETINIIGGRYEV